MILKWFKYKGIQENVSSLKYTAYIWQERHMKDLYQVLKNQYLNTKQYLGFPGGSDRKESAWNVGDLGSVPGLERSPGEEHGNPLQYTCLENLMGRGAWQAGPWVGKELDTTVGP